MAFGDEYWMVYLPAFNQESFLLFVNSPAGSTTLRDYSAGRAKVLGQPLLDVLLGTTIGRTRFTYEPHITTDDDYWYAETRNLNARHLSPSTKGSPALASDRSQVQIASPSRSVVSGQAFRGSQRQLQDYVNDHQEVITAAVMNALPPIYRELKATIKWVSPLAEDNYVEYRDGDFLRAVGLGEFAKELDYVEYCDGDFLRAVGLGEFAKELDSFWPRRGPSWDALGIISDPGLKLKPNVVLVEAKSHVSEIYESGCQADLRSRELIEKSLNLTKEWCNASKEADWTGSLYESANRLAYLYFIRERLKRFAWLVNLYFIDDPIGPADQNPWEAELKKVKTSLGINSNVIDVFLPALEPVDDRDSLNPGGSVAEPDRCQANAVDEANASSRSDSPNSSIQKALPLKLDSFETWANRWMILASYASGSVPDVANHIDQLVRLWDARIPGSWRRGMDPQLMGRCYRRRDFGAPHAGEHAIENDILCRKLGQISCLGYKLIDGINAYPLVRDEAAGRSANVEADMLLLGELVEAHRLFLCEVKDSANNPWYAVVESLRQLRLFLANSEAQKVFAQRGSVARSPAEIPVTGLVLAPIEYFSSRGKKENAVKPASELLMRFASEFGVDLRLAVWDATSCEIRILQTDGSPGRV